jgi:DNA-directed RNA polymerase specialized sigma24 family protein
VQGGFEVSTIDDPLVSHPRSGSAKTLAFEQFVVATRVGLMRAVSAHHGPQMAGDLVADAFAWGWANWDRLSAMKNPGGYLFRLADRLGQRKTMQSNREPATTSEHLKTPAWFDSPDNGEIAKLLNQLPSRQRAAVLLIHAYGYSYKEAALLLDIPLTTLTNDAIRGVKALRTVRSDS